MGLGTWLRSRRRRAELERFRRQFAECGFNLDRWTDAEVEAAISRAPEAAGPACLTADGARHFLGVLMEVAEDDTDKPAS
ncbi:MAG TPA: hypothetical protein VF064_14145 [Pyrinomonadaceae bacterium]